MTSLKFENGAWAPLTSRFQVVLAINEAAKEIDKKCNPGFWRFEDRERAAKFIPARAAFRQLWKNVTHGLNIEKAIRIACETVKDGIERNTLELIAHLAAQGGTR